MFLCVLNGGLADQGRTRTLLYHMHKFVSEQFPAVRIARLFSARSKENVPALGERFRSDFIGAMSRPVIVVDSNVLRVVAELSFDESTLSLRQRVTAALRT
jgi:hypothetical protein